MKKILFIILGLATISCSQQGKKPEKNEPHQVKKYTIEQFYKNLKIYGGSFSYDESKLLITSNKTGILMKLIIFILLKMMVQHKTLLPGKMQNPISLVGPEIIKVSFLYQTKETLSFSIFLRWIFRHSLRK